MVSVLVAVIMVEGVLHIWVLGPVGLKRCCSICWAFLVYDEEVSTRSTLSILQGTLIAYELSQDRQCFMCCKLGLRIALSLKPGSLTAAYSPFPGRPLRQVLLSKGFSMGL